MDFVGLFLNKLDNRPLYYQLYSYFVDGIRAGRLPAGERLPGKRTAAAQLGVSVNTVDAAYQMLAAEGYVVARPRSGFVVSRLEQLVPLPAAPTAWPQGEALPAADVQAEDALRAHPWRYSFSSSGLDAGLFPHRMWARLMREVLAEGPAIFEGGEAMGEAALRAEVAAYLRGWRGVRCEEGQIVVGAGLEVLCGRLARLYPGVAVAVENPGHPRTARMMANMGAAVRPVPVDRAGMLPAALRQSGAALAYLTPSHQFPTGGAMPVGRRMEMLQWAAEAGRLVVEDDYDSEFRFDGRPLPSLQGLDETGHVVYAGTFSRSLAPGLRVAYLVLPKALLPRWQAAYGGYACTVSRPEQQTLARLMAGGHFARSLNRARAAYKQKRGLLLEALAAHFKKDAYRVLHAHTGLYLVLDLPGQNAVQLAAKAREAGVRVRALNEYRVRTAGDGAEAEATMAADAGSLVLGYGGLPDAAVDAAVGTLAKVIAG